VDDAALSMQAIFSQYATVFWNSPEHTVAQWFLSNTDKSSSWWKWADYVRLREVTLAFEANDCDLQGPEFEFLLQHSNALNFVDPNECLQDQLSRVREICASK
jgi:hypothetical protein